jgi:hypothetical protein
MQLRVLLLFLFLLLPRTAFAQTLDVVQEDSLPRLDSTGQMIQKRALTMSPEAISARDCHADQRIRVPLQMSGYELTGRVEAWASFEGADCMSETSRSGPQAYCWKIHDDVPVAPVAMLDVRVQRLLARAAGLADPADEARACGRLDRTTLTMQFLYFDSAAAPVPRVKTMVDVEVDTIGPVAPFGVTSLPGDARVQLRWTVSSSRNVGTHVYCTRLSSSATSCGTARLPEGFVPDPEMEASFLCGTAPNMMGAMIKTTADGVPLENDARYAFAVAAVDAFGNVGPLSAAVCETPFVGPAIRDEDPNGGRCATAPTRASGETTLLALAIAIAVVLRRRGCRPDG